MFKMMKAAVIVTSLVFAGTASAALVVDGNFEETGGSSGWFSTAGVNFDNPANGPSLAGSQSASLPRPLGDQQIRSIAIAVAPGDNLTLTFDWKVDEPVDWWWQQVRFWTAKDQDNNTSGTWKGEVNTPFQADAAWKTSVVSNIVVPSGANYIDIVFNAGIFSPNFNGTLVIDNVDLAGSSFPIPEPATMTLLGLGLAAVIRKKK